MTCGVNMATPIHFIDDKCHTKLLKAGKSRETCLTICTWLISHHTMPLVINTLRGGHTHTHIPTHEPKQFQETMRVRPLAVHPWFKKQKHYTTTTDNIKQQQLIAQCNKI